MKTIKTIKDIKKNQLKVLIKYYLSEQRKAGVKFIKFLIKGELNETYSYILANGLIYYGKQQDPYDFNYNKSSITMDTDDSFVIKLLSKNLDSFIFKNCKYITLTEALQDYLNLFEGLEA